jgi:hypothetical protein
VLTGRDQTERNTVKNILIQTTVNASVYPSDLQSPVDILAYDCWVVASLTVFQHWKAFRSTLQPRTEFIYWTTLPVHKTTQHEPTHHQPARSRSQSSGLLRDRALRAFDRILCVIFTNLDLFRCCFRAKLRREFHFGRLQEQSGRCERSVLCSSTATTKIQQCRSASVAGMPKTTVICRRDLSAVAAATAPEAELLGQNPQTSTSRTSG